MSERTCKNRPAPDQLPGYYVQDGWTDDGRRNMVFHRTPWDPGPCGNAERRDDPRCDGCQWQFGHPRVESPTVRFEAECG